MTVTISKPAINIREQLTELKNTVGQDVGTTDIVTFGGLTVDTDTLHVDATNNKVGIGTTGPAQILHLEDSDVNTRLLVENTNSVSPKQASVDLKTTVREYRFISDFDGKFSIFDQTGASSRFTISTSGNVGIGTSAPATKLDVEGEIRSVGVNLAQGISQGNAGAVDARFAFNQDGTQIGWIGAPQWNSNSLFIYGPAASSGIEPVLKYSASQLELRTSNTNRLVIDSSGNVGIGTTGPHELLEIVDRAPILQIRDTNTGISDNKATLRLAESGAGGSTDQYYDVSLDNGNFFIHYGPTPRFKIDRTTGGVSIGTTTILGSGGNSKLSVKSGANYAPAIAIGNDGSAASWARLDFVNDQVTGGGTGIFYYDQGANFVMRNDEVGAGVSITVTDTGPTLRAGALRVESSGVVRIPNLAGTGTQDVQADASGNLVRITSDQRLKKEIADSPYGLAAVQALRPVTYRWRNEANMGSATEVGFVAQEVQAVIPEMVNETHATGMLSVSYSKLTAVLTAAIKEQQTQIEALEARLAVLEATP